MTAHRNFVAEGEEEKNTNLQKLLVRWQSFERHLC